MVGRKERWWEKIQVTSQASTWEGLGNAANATEQSAWEVNGRTEGQSRDDGDGKIRWDLSTAALAGVAQWTECRPVNQRVAPLIHSWGIGLGCEPGAQLEHARGKHTLMFLSSLSPSLPPL